MPTFSNTVYVQTAGGYKYRLAYLDTTLGDPASNGNEAAVSTSWPVEAASALKTKGGPLEGRSLLKDDSSYVQGRKATPIAKKT